MTVTKTGLNIDGLLSRVYIIEICQKMSSKRFCSYLPYSFYERVRCFFVESEENYTFLEKGKVVERRKINNENDNAINVKCSEFHQGMLVCHGTRKYLHCVSK